MANHRFACASARSRHLPVNRFSLHLLEWGTPGRPPLCFLHGGAAHAHWFDEVTAPFVDRFHVVSLDQRGHGLSDWPETGAYATEDFTGDHRLSAYAGLVVATVLIALSVLFAGSALLSVGPALATKPGDTLRAVGHPRERFPLKIFLLPENAAGARADGSRLDPPPPRTRVAASLPRAVRDWNAVFQEGLGVPAFVWTDREAEADILVRIVSARPLGPHGEVVIEHDDLGIVKLPVRIDLAPPADSGLGGSEAFVFGLVTHELGHALGLPHTDDVRSIMCCARDAELLANAEVRARYLEARRHPDVRSALGQVLGLYPRFWQP